MSLQVEYFAEVNWTAGNHSVYEVFVKAGQCLQDPATCARAACAYSQQLSRVLNPSTGSLEESIEFTVSRPDCAGCVGDQCNACVSYEDYLSGDELGWRESGSDGRRIRNWLGPDETWLQVFEVYWAPWGGQNRPPDGL